MRIVQVRLAITDALREAKQRTGATWEEVVEAGVLHLKAVKAEAEAESKAAAPLHLKTED